MPEQDLAGLLALVRARLAEVRRLLVAPRGCSLDECVTLFREAEGYLEWLRDSLVQRQPVPPGLRSQATALAGEIQQVGVLLERAGRMGRRWLDRLGPVQPEYTACGRTVLPRLSAHVSFFG